MFRVPYCIVAVIASLGLVAPAMAQTATPDSATAGQAAAAAAPGGVNGIAGPVVGFPGPHGGPAAPHAQASPSPPSQSHVDAEDAWRDVASGTFQGSLSTGRSDLVALRRQCACPEINASPFVICLTVDLGTARPVSSSAEPHGQSRRQRSRTAPGHNAIEAPTAERVRANAAAFTKDEDERWRRSQS